jgi:hypothetical protein
MGNIIKNMNTALPVFVAFSEIWQSDIENYLNKGSVIVRKILPQINKVGIYPSFIQISYPEIRHVKNWTFLLSTIIQLKNPQLFMECGWRT